MEVCGNEEASMDAGGKEVGEGGGGEVEYGSREEKPQQPTKSLMKAPVSPGIRIRV